MHFHEKPLPKSSLPHVVAIKRALLIEPLEVVIVPS